MSRYYRAVTGKPFPTVLEDTFLWLLVDKIRQNKNFPKLDKTFLKRNKNKFNENTRLKLAQNKKKKLKF